MTTTGYDRRKQHDEEIAFEVVFLSLPDGQRQCGFSPMRLVAEDDDWVVAVRGSSVRSFMSLLRGGFQ